MERTVLVTGSSSGIGRATVERFLEEDWTVYATARDPDDLDEFRGRDGCRVDQLDVTVDEHVDRVVERMIDETGRVDCLVNNAGYGQLGPVEDVPTEAVRDQYEVNVFGPHRLTRAVLPEMRRREDGTVIDVTSVAARLPFPGGGVYSGTKAALSAQDQALRAEVSGYGVDVVEVEPGPVETNFTDRAEAEMDGVDRSDAYEGVYRLFEDYGAVGGDGPLSVPPTAVADQIVAAASSTDPAPRYPVGPVARLATVADLLPLWARARLWAAVARLAGLGSDDD
ncbi:SDR family oxidoreductase [Halobaculum sp. MBLA0147]|uniref:SDR family oxidoreductase n=1 Tax=Halobaculum sp. MBLA0147 TaxID=3079934 RepID=UPI003526296D